MVFDIRFGGGVFKLGFIADVCVQHPNPLFFSFFLLILFCLERNLRLLHGGR